MCIETISIILVIFCFFIIVSFKIKKYTKIRLSKILLNVEIADNIFKKVKGLIGRKSLKENEGMLFPFLFEDYHRFSMMFMSFPIDFIFIDKNHKIIDIMKNVEPSFFKIYSPKKKAKYVLELKSGFTSKHKIKLGSKIDLNL